ncbi:MAG: hypothetical protein ACT6Q7_19640 [Blastomonas fulva]|uniref:hypothetical protein n=1 Tax=Blastomonas fulva TaxID=1550728 RepID=UPI004033461C
MGKWVRGNRFGPLNLEALMPQNLIDEIRNDGAFLIDAIYRVRARVPAGAWGAVRAIVQMRRGRR